MTMVFSAGAMLIVVLKDDCWSRYSRVTAAENNFMTDAGLRGEEIFFS
jgi:hypothetical protein